jgi:hypothetical protein
LEREAVPTSRQKGAILVHILIGAATGVCVAFLGLLKPEAVSQFAATALIIIGLALLAHIVSWFARFLIVGRIAADADEKIAEGAYQTAFLLRAVFLGLSVIGLPLLVFTLVGLLLDWNLHGIVAGFVMVVALSVILRSIIGLIVNVGMIVHERRTRKARPHIKNSLYLPSRPSGARAPANQSHRRLNTWLTPRP